MSNFSDTSVHAMLNAISPDTIKLHSGDPGAAGTANVISGAQAAATFGAASGRKRVASNVTIANVPALTSVSWYSIFAGASFVTRELIRSKHKTAGTNNSGGTVLTIGTATSSSPASGTVRVGSDEYTYTGRTGNTFTGLSPALVQTYAADVDVYAPIPISNSSVGDVTITAELGIN